jgi:hypothetical protein
MGPNPTTHGGSIDPPGASVKAVQLQLGHSTPMVTLNVYAHLFEDDLDRLYERLDASRSELSCSRSECQTASRRPGPARRALERSGQGAKSASELGKRSARPEGLEPPTLG